ncbi:MAG: GNAT family N-acetyltransferase [Planctomycetota bacterium]|jgi:ribosomal protein S18 acetylase RimI-like enzyme
MPEDVAYTIYRADLLPQIVAFWNRVFADRRNFFPIDEKTFLERIVEKKTAVEQFRPDGFLMAVRGDRVAGILHAGRNPEAVCRVLNPEWPGGEQGYVALVAVDKQDRRKGIGTELWRLGQEFFANAAQVVVDGQCLNPFYGNSEGPFTPLWGTPEGISVLWSDGETRGFFARRGYAPRYKGVHMQLDVGSVAVQPVDRIETDLRARGMEVRSVVDAHPEPGKSLEDAGERAGGLLYEALTAVEGKRVAAVLTTYPMMELEPGRHAIYEAVVHEDYRERGLGRLMLELAIERMRAQASEKCDVLTIPDVSEAAYRLYESVGFKPVEEWAIY